MFLSREAERLIRSFNSEAVYSQLVRIQRPSVPPPFHRDRQELNSRTAENNRKCEEDSLHTVRDIWRKDPEELEEFINDRDVIQTILPLPETQTSSSSAWRLASTNSSPVQQTQSYAVNDLPSSLTKSSPSPVRTGQDSFPLSSPPFENLRNSSPPSNYPPSNYFSPSIPTTAAVSMSPVASHTETYPFVTSDPLTIKSSMSPPGPIPTSISIGVGRPPVTFSHSTTNSDDVFHISPKCFPFPASRFSPLSLSQFPSQSISSQQDDRAEVKNDFDIENDVLTSESHQPTIGSNVTEVKDIELEEFIESRLEEIIHDNKEVQTTKRIFQPPTKQSKLTNYYPSRRSQLPTFQPPLKNGPDQDKDRKLLMGSKKSSNDS